jgi:hypothetical protein
MTFSLRELGENAAARLARATFQLSAGDCEQLSAKFETSSDSAQSLLNHRNVREDRLHFESRLPRNFHNDELCETRLRKSERNSAPKSQALATAIN